MTSIGFTITIKISIISTVKEREVFEMKKLVIEAENDGDMSVGIPSLRAKITIEANVDMEDVIKDLNYKDKREVMLNGI